MTDQASLISNAFQVFRSEAPEHAQAWGKMVMGLAQASALDPKTSALAYVAVLAALQVESSGFYSGLRPRSQIAATQPASTRAPATAPAAT